MPQAQALLIEIHYPDGSDALYLMTGQNFELLREDKGGREIYGLRHNEKEYLFFPFSFKAVSAGVLSMHMPAEYEESCLDKKADGARIVFGSTHGVPFFPEMPDEYQSSSGTIKVDDAGMVRIMLDKAEEGHAPSIRQDCGCGHAHHMPGLHPDTAHAGNCACGHGHEAHAHKAENGQARGRLGGETDGCCCGSRYPSDEKLAENIRIAAETLNMALRSGHAAGLCVFIGSSPHGRKGRDSGECPQVHIRQIARPL